MIKVSRKVLLVVNQIFMQHCYSYIVLEVVFISFIQIKVDTQQCKYTPLQVKYYQQNVPKGSKVLHAENG